MSAQHYELDNLVIIIDRNTLQISGRTEEVMGLEPLADKFAAFGCAVQICNGNDLETLVNIFDRLPFEAGKPNLVLAQTTKGKPHSWPGLTISMPMEPSFSRSRPCQQLTPACQARRRSSTRRTIRPSPSIK
jgi:hypothetical protein